MVLVTVCPKNGKKFSSGPRTIKAKYNILAQSGPGFFLGAWARGEGRGVGSRGGGRRVPTAHNSKTIHGIEMNFGRVVEKHKVINLV